MSDGTASGTWAATSTLGFASSNISSSMGTGYVPFWTSGNVFNNSALYYNGANFGIGTTTPTLGLLDVNGHVAIENQNELRMHETRDNGVNYVAFRASSTLGSDLTWTLPTTQGNIGDALMIDSSGNLFWGTPTGAGTINIGDTGWIPYYASDGTNILTATSSIFIGSNGKIGIGTTSTNNYNLTVQGSLYADEIYSSGNSFYLAGNEVLSSANGLSLYNSGNYFRLKASSSQAINIILSLPTTQGGAGDKLVVDGNGNLGWASSTFLSLLDTPSTYSGEEGRYLAVNAFGTGLEFASAVTGATGTLSGFVYDFSTATTSDPVFRLFAL